MPDIRQTKQISTLYDLSLDELIEYNMDESEIQDMIDKTYDKISKQIDWTNVWSKQYPILRTYQKEVKINNYAKEINKLLNQLQKEYSYKELDAMLVLKDILATVWQCRKTSKIEKHKK